MPSSARTTEVLLGRPYRRRVLPLGLIVLHGFVGDWEFILGAVPWLTSGNDTTSGRKLFARRGSKSVRLKPEVDVGKSNFGGKKLVFNLGNYIRRDGGCFDVRRWGELIPATLGHSAQF